MFHIFTKLSILTNNIFGVDLDRQAVDIAQLNLLLKVAEQKERLPTLQQNIKNGNSIIDDPAFIEKKPFEWKSEFREVMAEGGFDAVIGNPPYVRQEELLPIKDALQNYKIYNGSNDLYAYFFERGLNLLKEKGLFGFIVSSKFTKTNYGRELRQFILDNSKIVRFIDFGDLPVFAEATTYPCIIILEKSTNPKNNLKNKITVSKIRSLKFNSLDEEIKADSFSISQSHLTDEPWSMENEISLSLKKKIEDKGLPLKKFIKQKLYRGITTGYNDAFIIDEETKNELIRKDPKSKEIIRPFLTGKDIKRYSIKFNSRYLIYSYTGIDIDNYSAVRDYLLQFKTQLDKVWEVKNHKHPWYELRGCSYYSQFDQPKIIYPRINIRPNFTIDEQRYFIQDSAFFIPTSSRYVLGILNCKLMQYYAERICSLLRGGYYDYRYQYVELFPIATCDKNIEDKVAILVNKTITLYKKLEVINQKMTDERHSIEKEINYTEGVIDELVYDIYNITDDEKKVIEDSLTF